LINKNAKKIKKEKITKPANEREKPLKKIRTKFNLDKYCKAQDSPHQKKKENST